MGRWAAEVEKSFHKNVGKITFGELAAQWLESQKPNLKKQTAFSYQEALNRVSPFFDHRIVRDIRPEHIERFKIELLKRSACSVLCLDTCFKEWKPFGRCFLPGPLMALSVCETLQLQKNKIKEKINGAYSVTVRKLSPRSVNYSLWILRAVLDYAMKIGFAHLNAAKQVRGIKQHAKERNSFSLEELRKLFDVAEGQWKTLFTFAALVGCRMGECLAAKWANFNREDGTLDIRESFGQYGLGTPKTKTSIRTVSLPQSLVDKLMEHKAEQNQNRLQAGGFWKDNGIIFAAQNGSYLDQSNVRTVFRRTIKKAGLPKMRFHDLRGVAATLLLESGASLEHVMKQGGWKTPAMVLSVYARVTKEAGKKAQENLQRYVFGQPS